MMGMLVQVTTRSCGQGEKEEIQKSMRTAHNDIQSRDRDPEQAEQLGYGGILGLGIEGIKSEDRNKCRGTSVLTDERRLQHWRFSVDTVRS
jgi:hypothetical protein